MLQKLKARWELFLWRRKPYHERLAICDRMDRESNTPENRAREWDRLCDEHEKKTIGEVIRVRYAMTEDDYRAYLSANGWSGDEPASDILGPQQRRPIPQWFAVDRLGGATDEEMAAQELWEKSQC